MAVANTLSADNFCAVSAKPEPPVLQIGRLGRTVLVTWPRSALGFELEEQALLGTGIWTQTAPPVATDDANVMMFVPEDGQRIFRLIQP